MFKLYPILPWCFLIGAILGAVWVIGEKVLPPLRQRFRARMTEEKFSAFDRYVWKPVATSLACLNPAIALSGALNWAGNNNLVYGKSFCAVRAVWEHEDHGILTISFSAISYLGHLYRLVLPILPQAALYSLVGQVRLPDLRRYVFVFVSIHLHLILPSSSFFDTLPHTLPFPSLSTCSHPTTGLSVGVAISGLIVTLVFSFGAGKNTSFSWWGNDASTGGVDYQLYNNNASLYPLPASGHFGLLSEQYPLDW